MSDEVAQRATKPGCEEGCGGWIGQSQDYHPADRGAWPFYFFRLCLLIIFSFQSVWLDLGDLTWLGFLSGRKSFWQKALMANFSHVHVWLGWGKKSTMVVVSEKSWFQLNIYRVNTLSCLKSLQTFPDCVLTVDWSILSQTCFISKEQSNLISGLFQLKNLP